MTGIEGVLLDSVPRFPDPRGAFTEVARLRSLPDTFLQMNHSRSRKGVLRGLHYHRDQSDLWYIVAGTAQVALADLRNPPQPTTETLTIDASDPKILYVPPGVAHGYLALTDVDVIYLVTHEFDGSDEYGVAWNDPTLSIPWAETDPVLSDRDRSNPPLTWTEIPQFS